MGADVMESLTPGQQVVKIVHDELTQLMGGEAKKIEISSKPPTIIMMVGLQGSGKTTSTGKLARYLKEKMHKRPLLAACDVYRPAAIQQLKVLGQQLDIPVFEQGSDRSPGRHRLGRRRSRESARQRRRDHRHRRASAHRRSADAGARGDQGSRHTDGDPSGRRCR